MHIDLSSDFTDVNMGGIKKMLKLRLMGTPNDIKWFKKLMERHKRIKIVQESENYANKGTNRYYRTYLEIERKTEE